MTLSPTFLDELRARTLLSGLIGKSVKLQRAGREWKACCPFHQEKTPSFTINDDKGFYHCLAGETPVMTRAGRVGIAELAGQTVSVLTRGGRWVPASFANYGSQRLWRIDLSRNGVKKAIFATSHHRWFVRGRKSEVLTKELAIGHRLEAAMPEARTCWDLDPAGVRHGIMFGDGTLYKGKYGTINLHGEKDAILAIWFPDQAHHLKVRDGDRRHLRIYGGLAFSGMKQLPDRDAAESYLLGFLAGYLAADGHVAKDGTVMLNCADRSVLEAVRDMAASLGIGTYGVTTQTRLGLGAEKSAIHRIHFVTSSLSPLLFLGEAARERFVAGRKKFDRLRWTVTGVAPSDRVEDVFCAEVPGEHAFAIEDNILTGNCFGCGAHGDAIRYLTEAQGLSFMDAVKELASAAGMTLPAPDPRAAERAERQSGLHDVMAAAARWFEEQLGGIAGAEARAYLDRRGMADPVRRAFGLGFAPDSRGKLKAALATAGNDALIEAGLLISPKEHGSEKEPYDRFRGRLMIPIRDARGRTIAFGGRIIGAKESGGGEPKYLNSPETPLFDKGRTLFNLDRAGPASRKANRIVVVEGYMDVIALAQAGIDEAVAPLGTALTEAQLERLWRLADVPILCFDGDSAGQKAAIRAALRALPAVAPGRSLRFVTLPPGQDPDDLVRAGGREAIEGLLARPESLAGRIWRHELDAEPLDTPEGRAGLRRRLADHARTIRDGDVREQYLADFRQRFDELYARRPSLPERPFRGQHRGGAPFRQPPRPASLAARAIGGSGIDLRMARAMIAGLIRYPDMIARHAEAIGGIALGDRALEQVRNLLLDRAFAGGMVESEGLGAILAQAGLGDVAEELQRTNGLAFSFLRSNADSDRARRDLGAAIEALAARPELDAALAAATERLMAAPDEAGFAEQRRLRAAREEADRSLSALAEGADGADIG